MRIRLTGLLFAWDSLRTDRGVDPCHGTPSLDMLGSSGSRSTHDDGRTMPTPWRRSHEPRWRPGSNDAPAGSRERRTATTRGASHGRGPAPTGGGSSHGRSTRGDSRHPGTAIQPPCGLRRLERSATAARPPEPLPCAASLEPALAVLDLAIRPGSWPRRHGPGVARPGKTDHSTSNHPVAWPIQLTAQPAPRVRGSGSTGTGST